MASALTRLWHGWKRIARRIGEVQTQVVLTLLYFVLFAPLVPVIRAQDPLGLRKPRRWWPCASRCADLASAQRQ